MPRSDPLRFRSGLNPVRAATPEGVDVIVLEDREALGEGSVALPLPLARVLFHLVDGSRTRPEVVEGWRALTGRPPAEAEGLLDRLDDALVLEGERVEAARAEALRAWRGLAARPAAHAGLCYPDEAVPLAERIAAWREAAGVRVEGEVQAVLAPHIDPRGGGPCHGAAIEALARSPAEVFVVLGTAHVPLPAPFALTPHAFETPAGRMETDAAIVRRLDQAAGGGLLDGERAHAREHSVEFQATWLRALHASRPGLALVPVLVGSLAERIDDGRSPLEDPRVQGFVEALRDLLDREGSRVALVASIDLAHVGPNYGHEDAPDEAAIERVLEADRALLGHALAVDPAGWLRFLHEEKDARNVCGAAPTWVLLSALQGRGMAGRLLRHDLWEIDPGTGSHVSFCAAAYGPATGVRDGRS
jgi:AmmeMemoRadiSam system protein B